MFEQLEREEQEEEATENQTSRLAFNNILWPGWVLIACHTAWQSRPMILRENGHMTSLKKWKHLPWTMLLPWTRRFKLLCLEDNNTSLVVYNHTTKINTQLSVHYAITCISIIPKGKLRNINYTVFRVSRRQLVSSWAYRHRYQLQFRPRSFHG